MEAFTIGGHMCIMGILRNIIFSLRFSVCPTYAFAYV